MLREVSKKALVAGLWAVLLLTCSDSGSGGAGGGGGGPGSQAPDPAGPGDGGTADPSSSRCEGIADNRLAGSAAWSLTDPALASEIEGYSLDPSVERGTPVRIAVSTSRATTYRWEVFRTGHYGGAGARSMRAGGPLQGVRQAAPAVDSATGMIEARWPASFVVETQDAGRPWPSGVYLVSLTREDGKQSRAIFVLRDDRRDADVVVKVSSATWQAYNSWGGLSLYPDAPGQTRHGETAVRVSFDRPYHALLGYGAGQYASLELPLVSWLESQGYDVSYTTDADLGAETGRGPGRPRLFVSVGHDEYGSRLGVERLLEASRDGVNLAFLSGNTLFFAVRYEDTPAGTSKGLVCYKSRMREDPLFGVDDRRVTGRFRDPPISLPENTLLGVMSNGDSIDTPVDWVVTRPEHWIYRGTGVREGDRLSGLVFFEWDGLVDNGQAPANLEVIAASPVVAQKGPSSHHAVTYEVGGTRPAFVFSAGTNYFARHLATDERVARMMRNVLDRAGAAPCAP